MPVQRQSVARVAAALTILLLALGLTSGCGGGRDLPRLPAPGPESTSSSAGNEPSAARSEAANDWDNVAGWVVSPEGVGPLSLGLPGDKAIRLGLVEEAESEGCGTGPLQDTGQLRGGPDDEPALQTIWDGDKTLEYIYVKAPAFRTAEGIGIGSSNDDVQKVYGPDRAGLVKDDSGEGRLAVPGTAGRFLLFFDDDADEVGKITRMAVGRIGGQLTKPGEYYC